MSPQLRIPTGYSDSASARHWEEDTSGLGASLMVDQAAWGGVHSGLFRVLPVFLR